MTVSCVATLRRSARAAIFTVHIYISTQDYQCSNPCRCCGCHWMMLWMPLHAGSSKMHA